MPASGSVTAVVVRHELQLPCQYADCQTQAFKASAFGKNQKASCIRYEVEVSTGLGRTISCWNERIIHILVQDYR
jgi:hypothetical protein